MAQNIGYLTAKQTDESNECYTPYYAVDPILKYIPKDKIIWCPFDEEWSAFYQSLKQNGYKVIRSHLKDGQDFFKYEPEKWDILLSNPPFSLKDKILKRVDNFNKPFALLLPLASLQGEKRYPYLKKGIEVLCFDKRIAFHTENNFQKYKKGVAFATCYICRNILPKGFILEELIEYEKPLK